MHEIKQLATYMFSKEALGTQDVACVIDAKHLCVNSRGIKDIESSTVTAEFGGKFKKKKRKESF